MKRILTILSLILTLASCSRKNGEYEFAVCSVTDVHGRYLSPKYIGEERNKTSLSNVSTYIKKVRSECENVVFIDNGDALQGDNAAYYFNFVDTTSTHIYSKAAKYLGYDAVVVGNHDVEATHSVYDKIRKELGVPYLGANTAIDGTENSYYDRYTILKKGGLKIAVIGFTNPNIKSWISADHYSGFDILSADMAQTLVDEVNTKESPDFVIISIHVGTGTGEKSDFENPALYLAKTVKGIDMVICGHDHSPKILEVDNPAGKVILMNAGSRAGHVADCRVKLTFEKGACISKDYKTELVSMAEIAPDTDYDNHLATEFEKVKAFTTKPVCTFNETVNLDDALEGPSTYLNLVHEIQLKSSGADISIAAPLTRGKKVEKGAVVYNDMFTLYPYENQLYTIKMTGRQVKDYLELSFHNWINNIGPSFNFDSARGIIYKVYKSKPQGSRVEIASMEDGSPFDLNREYIVAMTSYRAMGGGDLLKDGAGINPADGSVIVGKYRDIRDMMYEYLTEQKEVTPVVNTNWCFVE